MKTKLTLLFVLLFIVTLAAQADTVAVTFIAFPSLFPDQFTTIARFGAGITNLSNQPVFLSVLSGPDTAIPPTPSSADGSACNPVTGPPPFPNPEVCNAAMELPLAPSGEPFSGAGFDASHFGEFGTIGRPPGVYPFTLFVYGGFTGANDFSLLGSGTTSITIVPEPGTLMLLGTGLVGVAARARRKLFQP